MLQIHLFQRLKIYMDGEPVHFSGLPKTTSLLAYLLLHRDQSIFRDILAGVLWGDVTDTDARANLRRHLHNLTHALPAANTPWLIATRKQIQWNAAANYWLDVAAFEESARSLPTLTETADLYSGDLLPELYEDWINPERERLKNLYLQTLTKLALVHQGQGDFAEALNVIQRILQKDPFQETVVRMAMEHLFYNMRDRAGALTLYQRFKAQLAEDLAVPPMPETVALFEKIADPQAAPTKIQTDGPPNNLSAPLNRFVGREKEMETLFELIRNKKSAVRLITITGTAGSGKTRLGLEAARKFIEAPKNTFSDGVFFTELAPLSQPDQVAEEIGKVLEIDESDSVPIFKRLISALSKKQLLLILDNFEHLLPAADLVSKLLRAAPALRILITSQAPLQLYGEHEFPLAPFPLPKYEPSFSLDHLTTNAAVALLVDRIHAVQPDFVLNDTNVDVVVDICRRLDGIPLALELAAARSKFFSLPSLLSQLNNRLHFLTGHRRNIPARQQTLRAAIDWSFQLLSEYEQNVLIQLSTFAGSITLDAADNVVTSIRESSTETVLYALVERNMVQFVSTPPGEPRRFSILSVLREYGLEKLRYERVLESEVRDRMALYYLQKVEAAENQMHGSVQADWLRWFHWEAPNLSAVSEYFLNEIDNGSAPQLLRFTMAMERVWELQGRFTMARQRLEQVLAYQTLLPVLEQIRLLNKVGGMAQWTGEYEIAVNHHEAALKLAEDVKDDGSIANTLHYLGTTIGRQGNYDHAQQLLEKSLSYYRKLPDLTPNKLSMLFNNLAIVYKRQKKYSEAETLLLDALSLRQEIGDQLGVANVSSTLGGLILEQGRIDQAKSYLLQSLQIRHTLGDRNGIINTLHHLAVVGVQEERWDYSITLFAYCAFSREQMGNRMAADFQTDYDRAIEQIKSHVEGVEIAARWEQSKNFSAEQIVAFAQTDTF